MLIRLKLCAAAMKEMRVSNRRFSCVFEPSDVPDDEPIDMPEEETKMHCIEIEGKKNIKTIQKYHNGIAISLQQHAL